MVSMTALPNASELGVVAEFLLWLLGVVTLIGGASTVIIRMLSPFKKMKADLNKHAELLDKDKKRLDEHEESSRLTLKAMMILIDHELTGNSVVKLKDVKDEINAYLINR